MAKIQAWKVLATLEHLDSSLNVETSIIERFHQQRPNAAEDIEGVIKQFYDLGYYTLFTEGLVSSGNYTMRLAHTIIAPSGAGYVVRELEATASIESIIITE